MEKKDQSRCLSYLNFNEMLMQLNYYFLAINCKWLPSIDKEDLKQINLCGINPQSSLTINPSPFETLFNSMVVGGAHCAE